MNMVRMLVGGLICASAVGCGISAEDAPFDPVAMQSMYKARAQENRTPAMASVPTELDRTYLTTPDGKRPASRPSAIPPTTQQSFNNGARFTLRELIQLAALNNLEVKVAGYEPAVNEARVIEADARFDPVFFSNLNFATQYLLTPSPSASSVQPNQNNFFETATWATGIKQNLPNGAQIQLQYQSQRVFRFPPITFNGTSPDSQPFFENSLQFQITQPLLQNFGTEVNMARVVVARNNQRISLLDFRLALEKSITEIEDAYWQLHLAEKSLAIQENLFNQTVNMSVVLLQRVGQDVTRVELGQANAALRSRASSLVEARKRVRTLSNAIKRRVNDPDMPVSSPTTVLTADQPITQAIEFDLAEQIEAAMKNRAELKQQEIRIASARVVTKAAKNNTMPQLNLVGQFNLKGAGNTYGSTLETQFHDFSYREYTIGLQFEMPLGNREPLAIQRRTLLQLQQSIDQYRALIEQISEEVRNAHDDVVYSWQRYALSSQAYLAAADALDALETDERVGNKPLNADFVNRKLNSQEILANTQRDSFEALSQYNIAIATLERAKGTILKYDNILIEEEPNISGGVRVQAKPGKP